jgi:hypothetical protein
VIDWAARALVFFQKGQAPTPITPETKVVGVSGVLPPALQENDALVSGVMGVAPPPVSNLIDAQTLTADLLYFAMRVCDRHGDGPEAREEMTAAVLATPTDLQPDLLAHFKGCLV